MAVPASASTPTRCCATWPGSATTPGQRCARPASSPAPRTSPPAPEKEPKGGPEVHLRDVTRRVGRQDEAVAATTDEPALFEDVLAVGVHGVSLADTIGTAVPGPPRARGSRAPARRRSPHLRI